MIMAAIAARAAKAMVATAALLAMANRVKATRARTTSSALPRLADPPSTILGLGPSTCTSV
jgi:hypothetical protein